jgi:hypothetical protein
VIERMTASFGSKTDAASVASEADLARLHAKIGQLERGCAGLRQLR